MCDLRIFRTCPICDSSRQYYSHRHCFEPIGGISLLSEFLIVVCDSCGMAYVNTLPNQNDISFYYRNFSKYETVTDEQGISDCGKDTADFIIEQLPFKQSDIVDIGCGAGHLLMELQNHGYTSLTAVELSEENCRKIQSHNIKTYNKSLFELDFNDFVEAPDCIILSSVLEHIADLRLAVRTISDLIKKGSIAVVVVPQLEYFEATEEFVFEEISREHINYFSINSLNLLMSLHGLKLRCYKELKYNSSAVLNAIFYKPEPTIHPLERYITSCTDLLTPTIQVIDDYFLSQKPIVIWGTGTLCQYLFANSRLAECNILQLIDKNKYYQGHCIGAHRIAPPSILLEPAFTDADIFTLTYRFNDEITRAIREMGLCNTIANLPIK